MCGIIGYTGHRPAVPVILEGLRRLEYRGYDSAGIAWEIGETLHTVRAAGKLRELENLLAKQPAIISTCAMGHTRWATHGSPVERNAHPHQSNDRSLAIVHNGIIENFHEIRQELLAKGYSFNSDTDTEVLVNLISEYRKSETDLIHAIAAALRRAHGAYAICVMCADEPGVLYGARMAAPLIIGKGTGENFLASDIPAFLSWTREAIFLENGEIVRLEDNAWQIFNLDDLRPCERQPQTIQWDMQAAQKDGYRHFMLKEIFEQPRVLRDGMAGRVVENRAHLAELDQITVPERLRIVACGTSYHAGLWARYLFESWADIPCEVEIASEFRYRDLASSTGEIALLISQSGETADTLAALHKARDLGMPTIGLCNVMGSTIAREADAAIFTQAGPEISVASTKAMASQMLALALMAIYWATRNGRMKSERAKTLLAQLSALPSILDDNLPEMRKRARALAQKYATSANFFYLGRGHMWPLALEGALKLKELSYIHAEGYAAGEMKHGPIALIDPSFPTFAIALEDELFSKMKSNLEEVNARAGRIIALANPGAELDVADIWIIPKFSSPLSAFLVLPCLQLFSYEAADFLGKDVDQPRNLAKSVTVE